MVAQLFSCATKQNGMLLLGKVFVILLVVGIAFGKGPPALAEVLTCTVGDLSKGNWCLLPRPIECLYPGPPATGSSWPRLEPVSQAYRVEGRYKIIAQIIADGPSWTIPPEGPKCITGFAEAYAAAACLGRNEGTLCTITFTNGMKNYIRYFDGPLAFMIQVWLCNPSTQEPVQPNHNQGPPSCSL